MLPDILVSAIFMQIRKKTGKTKTKTKSKTGLFLMFYGNYISRDMGWACDWYLSPESAALKGTVRVSTYIQRSRVMGEGQKVKSGSIGRYTSSRCRHRVTSTSH